MGLLFPPPFALRVWLPVVCCPLVAEPCHDQLRWGLPSSWDLGWVHLTWAVGLGVQDMVHRGQRVCSQSNPGVGAGLHIGCDSLCAHSLVCIHPSEFSVCIQGFEPAEPGLGHTLPGQRLGCHWDGWGGGVGQLGSVILQPGSWLTQTSVSRCRILTGCWRPCRLPLPRTRVLASCSAASAARAGPRPPWWWLCLSSGTSKYVRPPV